jgi:hypothetical protein
MFNSTGKNVFCLEMKLSTFYPAAAFPNFFEIDYYGRCYNSSHGETGMMKNTNTFLKNFNQKEIAFFKTFSNKKPFRSSNVSGLDGQSKFTNLPKI